MLQNTSHMFLKNKTKQKKNTKNKQTTTKQGKTFHLVGVKLKTFDFLGRWPGYVNFTEVNYCYF